MQLLYVFAAMCETVRQDLISVFKKPASHFAEARGIAMSVDALQSRGQLESQAPQAPELYTTA
jgi:hypothetical protein